MKKTSPKAPKSTSLQSSRRPFAKRPQKPGGTPGPTGKLTKEERDPLLLQAKDAFEHQSKLGNVEPGYTFDEWRRDRVHDSVELPGISKINRSHWRTVMATFLTLSGREDEAFSLLNQTGLKSYRPANQGDTWESSESLVAHMRSALAAHAQAAVTHPKGHIQTGWLLHTARQRTGKPQLTIENMAERLDPETLTGILAHLRNHIALREGRADLTRRKQRQYPAKPDPGTMHEDQPF